LRLHGLGFIFNRIFVDGVTLSADLHGDNGTTSETAAENGAFSKGYGFVCRIKGLDGRNRVRFKTTPRHVQNKMATLQGIIVSRTLVTKHIAAFTPQPRKRISRFLKALRSRILFDTVSKDHNGVMQPEA